MNVGLAITRESSARATREFESESPAREPAWFKIRGIDEGDLEKKVTITAQVMRSDSRRFTIESTPRRLRGYRNSRRNIYTDDLLTIRSSYGSGTRPCNYSRRAGFLDSTREPARTSGSNSRVFPLRARKTRGSIGSITSVLPSYGSRAGLPDSNSRVIARPKRNDPDELVRDLDNPLRKRDILLLTIPSLDTSASVSVIDYDLAKSYKLYGGFGLRLDCQSAIKITVRGSVLDLAITRGEPAFWTRLASRLVPLARTREPRTRESSRSYASQKNSRFDRLDY
ncbi:hypothetical protein PDE_01000 [Penicillium oxalicum 114-2]|uniref:Uncharacterized protein n=1 Tax=Penicillium oxalicum (strain 114-2 / CGMCC 5302) TaxID=933388 RepID=S7Z7C2_PENO1|nr:hypothetical protein PDE_01000 [Penicillium oxalicum 114-2]